ncbi:MAG: hypothetical protein RLZZ306_3141 [Bacteroidota bacterium]
MKRVLSIDIIRGIVIIIMALDHVRDLIHIDSITQSPTNLATTTPFLFFTRWITHLCAPIFVFLSGTSAFIVSKNYDNLGKTKKYLIKRGLWLIFLEFTIVNFGLYFDIGFHTFLFEVIATIGIGFVMLGLMLKIPSKYLGITGLIIIFTHNLTPLIPFAEGSILKVILAPFFSPAMIPLFADKAFTMAYPPIPWFGIMLIGFACGQLFELPSEKRKSIFLKIGISALAMFIIIRFVNIYGDSVSWTLQKDSLYTFLSFMNVSKYPPSLVFCLITLGVLFSLLAFADQFNTKIKNITSIYGKVPLFYFVVHFYLIHLITLMVLFVQGFSWSQFEFAKGTFGRPQGIVTGLSLWAIYLIWIGVVLVLYYPCKWYGRYKTEKKYWWLSYL